MATTTRMISGATIKISARARYACLAIIELARPTRSGSPKRLNKIASAQEIPPAYLVQILLKLKAAGLVQSARGANGGYQLARSAAEISIGEIITAVDGCQAPTCEGPSITARRLSALLSEAHAAKVAIFAATTVAQLVEDEQGAAFATTVKVAPQPQAMS
jgi:Rrf2 family transcriptional regulator, cysteine metabolism repressor